MIEKYKNFSFGDRWVSIISLQQPVRLIVIIQWKTDYDRGQRK